MTISSRLRYEILRRDNYACRYCGRAAPNVALTVDAVIPEALGGSHKDPANLATACADCNSGKASMPPDAPLVADVAADALRWARAMARVAEIRAYARQIGDEVCSQFEAQWRGWTYPDGGSVPLEEGWQDGIKQMLEAGLELDDLLELTPVAMWRAPGREWKYFCGCCWNRLRDNAKMAASIIATDPEV